MDDMGLSMALLDNHNKVVFKKTNVSAQFVMNNYVFVNLMIIKSLSLLKILSLSLLQALLN